jgi:acyl-CoA thioesterase-1
MPFAFQFQSLTYGVRGLIANCTLMMAVLGLPAMAEPVVVAALGDSLTAGYGLPADQGLVPQLQAWLDGKKAGITVINAGVSGDTTAGGLSRLDWTLTPDVDALIVTLGGNDMLRGLDPSEARANLDGIVKGTTDKGLPVLIVGMKAPGNYGPDYKTAFDANYPALAATYGTLFIDDFFASISADPNGIGALMQADGIHPNAKGVEMVVAALGPKVVELAARVKD